MTGSKGMQLVVMNDNLYRLSTVEANLRHDLTDENHQDFTQFFFQPVRINSANKDLLRTLPRIGPAMADKIIAFRSERGPITSKEDFLQIEGIGVKAYSRLQGLISFD